MAKNRIFYALLGVLVMLFAGFVYAWSILSAPISADFPQWGGAQLSLTFSLCMAFFCLGGMAAGALSRRCPVRFNLVISAVLFLAGFALSSASQTLPSLYIGYGLLCGTASGFAYNSVMNVMPQWFPAQPGLISGVLLMGFGASSMLIGSAFTALTPAAPGAWRTSLLFMGVLMCVLLLAASFFFTPPKAGELPAPNPAKTRTAEAGALELSPAQMLRRPSFWFFFLWVTLLSAAGLVVISQARPMAFAAAPSFGPAQLSLVVGLISVCNGLGRVVFGALFDSLGRKKTMFLVSLTLTLGALAVTGAVSLKSAPLLTLGFLCTGLGYGGGPTMSAAFTKAFYGAKNYPVNFSLTNTSLLVASFAGTLAGGIYDAMGGYAAVFVLLLALLATSFVVSSFLRSP